MGYALALATLTLAACADRVDSVVMTVDNQSDRFVLATDLFVGDRSLGVVARLEPGRKGALAVGHPVYQTRALTRVRVRFREEAEVNLPLGPASAAVVERITVVVDPDSVIVRLEHVAAHSGKRTLRQRVAASLPPISDSSAVPPAQPSAPSSG